MMSYCAISGFKIFRRTAVYTVAYTAAALLMASVGSNALAQASEDYEGDTVENTPLGEGWTGNVDASQGSCAIFKVQGPVHMSLYSDRDDHDGYWLFSGINGAQFPAKFPEGPARVQIAVNDSNIGEYAAELSVDGPRYSYKLPYLALDEVFAEQPDGVRLKMVQGGRVVHRIDATGALKAYAAYRKCNANLAGSGSRR